jgi:mono/diheme cytochrome c family protein
MLERLHPIGYLVVLVVSLITSSSFAAEPDPAHGETLAKRWCASCHLVGAEQKEATTDAPPFAVVANEPEFNSAKLAFFLLDPHPKMPNMAVSRVEAADIAAYIATLGPPQKIPQRDPTPAERSH